MSDYAGAIGSVLSIVGMATGQVWLTAIGMAVSAWGASQQVLPGPKIGEVQKQTSQEGGFRPIIYGRSHPIMGNIIADGGPVIVTRQERQGKGGPKVESESAYRTYAVGFCEGWAELLQVWRNGILVYDAEDPGMAAENAKFREYATWFTGTLDQPVSADLEEIYGAGNAPYFRGTAYLVLHNEDVTDQRGAWSQWQVRVNTQPPEAYLTSKPYPVYQADGIRAALQPSPALLRPLLFEVDNTDRVDATFNFGVAQLRAPVVEIESDEQLVTTFNFGVAQLRAPVVEIELLPEEVGVGFTFQVAILREALITQVQPSEEIDTTFTFGEASIYVP